ncbi:hypothetical protein LPJ77_001661 [Coemansia sp. RSA 2523]|nr:hypothetical protein LPJ58_006172 [Coemansia sp. RSA 1591]KAJ1748133.1 hypothetical protein LPJ69_006169 [Coemansia sp. RSA 1752]KAJ1778679.1 hypothetical protein LPJ67_006046 [Coemansia sp. RSA 1938]KAJ1779097.1 hypothetical protein LPJ54_001199 [Coemansia sp. RSA 1824]KAJ1793166.1 hypothetical protein LPJ62_000379 [Coemansia sp. RSA 2167]KAJ1809411.1 hypothetical protein LPJ77_001661 [Coemansia sp. RSA 2523]KAJ2118352.1 hypothetical protein GGF48_004615 [Coemansia sp. RSA 921]KAJ2139054
MTDVPLDSPSSYTLSQQPKRPLSSFEQRIHAVATSPYAVLTMSVANLAALTQARKLGRGYPTVISCLGHAGIFAAAAVALQTGDTVNGSALATVWSANWLMFNARKAFTSRRVVPISMVGLVASIGSAYGYQYFVIDQ